MKEKALREILNSIYLDGLGPGEFNATLANGTVDAGVRKLKKLISESLPKEEDIEILLSQERGGEG